MSKSSHETVQQEYKFAFRDQDNLTVSSIAAVNINNVDHALEDAENIKRNGQEDLKSYKNSTPSEDHICPECNFAFSSGENLTNHLKNIHPNSELGKVNLEENVLLMLQGEHSRRKEAAVLENPKISPKPNAENLRNYQEVFKKKCK